uniref:Mitochondrial import inner membrane translocase subunit Tim13 n=1 Tax=Lygus hesperus TaxID=30085 RepID=A0A0A9ZDX7_LYGHE
MGPSAKPLKTEVSVDQIMAMEKGQMMNLVKMSYGCASLQELINLVSSFLSEIKPPNKSSNEHVDSKEDQVKKKCRIKERLVFFHSVYNEMSEPKFNEPYLSAMSDLLALYIDLEVVTCLVSLEPEKKKRSERREKEEKEKRMKELLSRILSSLYTMLDKSEDHILDTVLKLRPPFNEDATNEIFHAIYASIYRSVAKRAANRQIRDLTYVRYVLVYKLWDNISKDSDREEVIKQAATRLRPPPGFLKRRRTLPRILPKPPKDVKNLTEFFLRERYNLWKSAKKLLEATSQAAHQSTMFPNLSCKPRLLNPRIQESTREPSPSPNAPLEEISTPQSMADDLWTRLRCEAPISETSLYDQHEDFHSQTLPLSYVSFSAKRSIESHFLKFNLSYRISILFRLQYKFNYT